MLGFISVYIYIYIVGIFGKFSIKRVGFKFGFGLGFPKTRTYFEFYFKNLNPALLFIGLGKTQPIRVGPSWVPTGQVTTVISKSILPVGFLNPITRERR